ncbi:hypothetical protein BH09BAC5_BH09BAC5_02020 [soil metagenome]
MYFWNNWVVLFLSCIFIHGIVRGQTSADNLRLNSQLNSYAVNFGQLMQTRGVSNNWFERNGAVTGEDLQDCLDRRNNQDNLFDQSRGLEVEDDSSRFRKTIFKECFLFYFHKNDTLYGYIIRTNQPMVSFTSVVSADSLLLLEYYLKRYLVPSFKEQSVIATRGPVSIEGSVALSFDSINIIISQILFPQEIRGALSGIRFLNIIPVLNIGSIPFYILKPFGNNSFLVDSMCVVINHNPTHTIEVTRSFLKENDFLNNWQHLDFSGKYVFTPINPIVIGNPSKASYCNEKFSSLDGAEIEAINVAKILKVDPLIGNEAIIDSVILKARGSDFLYLATHAWANTKNPMDSSFLLLVNSDGSCARWSPREIQNDSLLKGALVILSACESGQGGVLNAGVIGLSRAFIKSGAQNVIYSMWPVQDVATSEIMLLFLNELEISQPFFPAENLRQAILKYKQSNPSPQTWGAFSIIGVPFPSALDMKLQTN